ncbi:MAG: SCO family protein [Asticcacaulis sp.]
MNRIRLTIILACVVALAGLAVTGWYRSLHRPANVETSQVDPSVRIGGPFTLVDTEGHRVTEAALKGKWSAVFFGYTFCPDICPTTFQVLGRAQKMLGADADNLQFLFITVDPARDTPGVLRAYVQSGGFPSHVMALTGTDAQIAGAAKAYRATYQKVEQKDGTYIMGHTGVVYLMNPQGQFTVPLTGDMSPQQVADQIRQAQKDYAAVAH